MSSNQTIIEVLICTHNSVKLLERALKYLNQAKSPTNCAISLLIVANACSDKTITFLQKYPLLHQPENILISNNTWENINPYQFKFIPEDFLDHPRWP